VIEDQISKIGMGWRQGCLLIQYHGLNRVPGTRYQLLGIEIMHLWTDIVLGTVKRSVESSHRLSKACSSDKEPVHVPYTAFSLPLPELGQQNLLAQLFLSPLFLTRDTTPGLRRA
jgi:hypothetical protein